MSDTLWCCFTVSQSIFLTCAFALLNFITRVHFKNKFRHLKCHFFVIKNARYTLRFFKLGFGFSRHFSLLALVAKWCENMKTRKRENAILRKHKNTKACVVCNGLYNNLETCLKLFLSNHFTSLTVQYVQYNHVKYSKLTFVCSVFRQISCLKYKHNCTWFQAFQKMSEISTV